MIPPTSIDGTDITGATIDGTDVTEITVDGDVVFSGESTLPQANLHTRYDFSLEDGTTPITDRSQNSFDLDTGGYSGVSRNINGVQSGEFDGTDDDVSASYTLTSGATFHVVIDPDTIGTNADGILDFDGTTTPTLYLADNEVRSTNDLFASTNTSAQIITLEVDTNDDSNLYVNGTLGDSGTTRVFASTIGNISIGTDESGSFDYYDGLIGECLIYDTYDESRRSDVENYLSNKWGITL